MWPTSRRWSALVRIGAITIMGLLIGACGGPIALATPTRSEPSSRPSIGPTEPSDSPGPNSTADSSQSAGASDRLEVVCDRATIMVDIPVVIAQDDGVHVEVVNVGKTALDLTIEHRQDGPQVGESVARAGSVLVESIPPGSYLVSCGGPSIEFTIVDPKDLYVPSVLACDVAGGSGTTGSIDYAPDAVGPRGRLVDVARSELRGLRADDQVERAGYPAGAKHLIRVVRDRQTVAALSYADDGQGGWLLTGSRACAGSGLTADPPD